MKVAIVHVLAAAVVAVAAAVAAADFAGPGEQQQQLETAGTTTRPGYCGSFGRTRSVAIR